MTSNETDEKMRKSSKVEESVDIDDKLEAIRCPFTWMTGWSREEIRVHDDDTFAKRRIDQFTMLVDRQDYFPELEFIYHLMLAFGSTMENESSDAMEYLNKAEYSFNNIKQQQILKNVENALEHIFIGTKCHILKRKGQSIEVNELLKQICIVDDMNNVELAMLSGCQCSALLLYNTDNSEKLSCAKSAIEYEPDNGKWHYLMGRICRDRRRKEISLYQKPDEEEISSFQKAYSLFPNPLFGVSLARMYREISDFDMASNIYNKVHALQPTSCSVRLQLALGFIRHQKYTLAKECLDYVAEKMPDCIQFSHYMGIYEEKCNEDAKAALPYYKETTDRFNHAAELQYIACRKKVETDWDPLPYLLDLLKKYDGFNGHIIREINIQIGSYYIFEMHKIVFACQYLIKAIEFDPNHKLLKNHFPLLHRSGPVNIYDVLSEEIQAALQIGGEIYNNDEITILKETLELCRQNYGHSWEQAKQQKSASSHKNYNREFSIRSNTNWRRERSDSRVGAPWRNYSTRSFSGGQTSPQKSSGSSSEKDFTSWRSDKQFP